VIISYWNENFNEVLNYTINKLNTYPNREVILNGYLVYAYIDLKQIWKVKISAILYLCYEKNITLAELTIKDIEGLIKK